MTCQVCLSILKAGDLFCSSCGAAVPDAAPSRATAAEACGRIAGERKYLTVLCVDLQRSTDLISDLDPEEAITRLEPALVAMRTAVRRNRGIVSKEGGDGLIALFGAPHADDNHALMACHAAVELVRRIKLLNDPDLHLRVGLHSGYVVAHTIEADLSSIYEAGGPAVHLVKRFESAAQAGQILVSESCQSLSAGLVTFKKLPPRRMEGFPAPVPCYELVEISGLTRWRVRSTKGLSSFVGRAEEISVLERAAQEARSSGQIVALVGTAGVGKSRMAHEFAESLRRQDWQVLEAECNPLEQSVPYSLLKKLLQAVQRDPPSTKAVAPAEGASVHADLWPAALCAVLDATEYFQISIDAVDKQPESTLREQRAIDLRIEARLAFLSLGSIEEWLKVGRRRGTYGENRRRTEEAGLDRGQSGCAQLLRNALRGTFDRGGSGRVGQAPEQRKLAGACRVWACRTLPGFGTMAWPDK